MSKRRSGVDTTKRTDTEPAQRHMDELFRALIENASDVITILDAEGIIRYQSPSVERVLGYKPHELIGRDISELLHQDDLSKWLESYAAMKAGVRSGTPQSCQITEERLRQKDGSWRILEGIAKVFDTPSGARIVINFRDITERKQVYQELHESEERYRSLVEAAPDVIYTISAEDGLLTSLNPAFETLTGWSRAEWLGKPFMGIVHPDDLPVAVETFQKASRGETQPPYELRVLCKTGEYLLGEFTSTPHIKDGKVVGELGIARDITERKQAEEALRESEERFRAIVENAPFGYYRVGKDGLWQYVNPVWERMHGLSSGEIIAKRFEITQPPDSVGEARELVKRALAGETIVGEFGRLTREGNTEYHSFNIQPVKHRTEIVGIEGFINDITERKRAEEALRESEEKHRTLFETMAQGVLYQNAEGQIISANPAAERLLGLTLAEMLGRTSMDPRWKAIHEDGSDFPGDMHPGMIALKTGKEVSHVMGVFRPGANEYVWINIHAVPQFRPGETKPYQVYTTFDDITERKRAEAQIFERHRLATLVAEVGVALTEAEGLRQGLQQCAEILVRHINAAFARIWTVNEADKDLELEASAGMYTHIEGGRARVPMGHSKIGRIAENGEPHLTNTVQQDSGVTDPEWARREGMVAFAGYPLKVEERVLGVVAAFARKPLTPASLQAFASVAHILAQFIKRKRTEEALRESEGRFRSLVENATVGIYRTTPEGHILMANPALVRMLGFDSFEELATRNLECGGFEPSYPRSVFRERIEREGQVVGLEAAWVRRDGSVILVRESARAVRADDGRLLHYDGIVEDITTRRHAEEGMRRLSGRLLRLQDEERRRIARELHETAAQSLAGLAINLNIVKTSAADLSPRASACLSESLELAEQCSREIRTLSYLLHPPLVDEAGLAPALRWYTAGFAQRSGIAVHVDVSPEFGRLPSEFELALYRIVQEALTNIHLHSGSKTARICLERWPNGIVLTVADEGHGFPSAALGTAGPESTDIGVGIPGMRERLRQLGGRLHIQTGSRGTTLRAILPLGEVTNGQTTHPTGG